MSGISDLSAFATLTFGELTFGRPTKSYLVSDFKCRVTRRHNEARPDAAPRCETMEITVVSPVDGDAFLYEWYSKGTLLSGWLQVVLPPDGTKSIGETKTILFENALCHSLSEEYHIDRNLRRLLRLGVAAETLIMDTVTFKSNQVCPN